jgi:hypothetical protein
LANRPIADYHQPTMHSTRTRWTLLATAGITLVLAACAQLQPAVAALPWQDAWGERGRHALARDYAMRERLVEQRRSLLAACLHNSGRSI